MKIFGNKNTLQIIESCYSSNLPLLLMGETGVGKTTIIREVAKKKKKTVTRINLNGQTGREEILGKYVLENGSTIRQDGPLLKALRDGDRILLDEINAALPEVLFTLQALIETNNKKLGNINLVEKNGEIIEPHKDCRIFATANPADRYIGAKDFNIATLSRFVVMNVEKLNSTYEIALLKSMFPIIDEGYIYKCVEISKEINLAYESKDISYYCSTRDLIHTLELVSNKISFSLALKTAILNKVQSREERVDVKNIIDKIEKLKINTEGLDIKNIIKTINNIAEFNKEKKSMDKEISENKKLIEELKDKLSQFETVEDKFKEAANLFSNI